MTTPTKRGEELKSIFYKRGDTAEVWDANPTFRKELKEYIASTRTQVVEEVCIILTHYCVSHYEECKCTEAFDKINALKATQEGKVD